METMGTIAEPAALPFDQEVLDALGEAAKRRGEGKYCILLVVDENNELTWSTVDVSTMVAPTE